MLSEEEKKAIEEIKKDDEYYDILQNVNQNKYNMWNVQKLMKDTTDGSYTEYEIVQCIIYFVNLIEKQQKEIENLKQGNIMLIEEKEKAIKALGELEKKDKVINEMAKDLMQFVKEPILLPNEIIKEYIKKVERNEDIN